MKPRHAPPILLAAALIAALLLPRSALAQAPTPSSNRLFLPLLLQSAPPALPFAQRQAVLDAIRRQFDAQSGVDVEAERAALVDFIRRQPHIAAAGVAEDGAVWGRFSDDRLLIVASRPVSDNPAQTAQAHTLAPASAPANLPGSAAVYVLNALGSCYSSHADTYAAWLTSHGYAVSPIAATVPELRTVKNGALFYIDTHGGGGYDLVNQKTYALWTATPVDMQMDLALASDLIAGRLVYFLADHDRAQPPATGCVSAWHYGLTPRFVATYMTFAPHSLAWFNGCSSMSQAAVAMSKAFQTAGAAMYGGWTQSVNDASAVFAADVVFDGMLGANTIVGLPPPQRPFDVDTMRIVMANAEVDQSDYCPARNGSCPPNAIVHAVLHFIQLVQDPDDAFFQLRPTITSARPNDPPCCTGPDLVRLEVYGQFGDEPGQVLVGDAPVRVLSWTSDVIQAELPPHGPGAAGDIVVKVGSHASNGAPLTDWRGQVRWREHYDQALGVGPYAEVTCDLHLRANFHPWRKNFGDAVVWPPMVDVVESQDSRCTWQMGGESTYTEPSTGVVVRGVLSGSGEFTWRPPSAGPGPYLGFNGAIIPQGPERGIGFSAIGLVSGQWTVYRDGVLVSTSPHRLLGTGPVRLPLDSRFNIQAGSSIFTFPQGPVTTTWGAIPARFAPTEQTPG